MQQDSSDEGESNSQSTSKRRKESSQRAESSAPATGTSQVAAIRSDDVGPNGSGQAIESSTEQDKKEEERPKPPKRVSITNCRICSLFLK